MLGSLEGRVIDGRLEVGRAIAAGGVGSVYEARHRLLGRNVALKVVEAFEAGALSRLRAEAQAIARIQSVHVVGVIDFGFDEGLQLPYLVMELAAGTPLSEAPRPMPWRDASELVRQLLLGIEAAHAASVVHRDLKPANIVVSRLRDGSPRVKILDFGIARLLWLDANITRTGELVGSPAYMAPEQIVSSSTDGRADLWAAGVVLYELVAGRRPFDGPDAISTFQQITREIPQPISSLVPEAAPLDVVLERALEKDPDARFTTALEMREALEAATSSGNARLPTPGPVQSPRDAATTSTGVVARASGATPARRVAATAVAALLVVALGYSAPHFDPTRLGWGAAATVPWQVAYWRQSNDLHIAHDRLATVLDLMRLIDVAIPRADGEVEVPIPIDHYVGNSLGRVKSTSSYGARSMVTYLGVPRPGYGSSFDAYQYRSAVLLLFDNRFFVGRRTEFGLTGWVFATRQALEQHHVLTRDTMLEIRVWPAPPRDVE